MFVCFVYVRVYVCMYACMRVCVCVCICACECVCVRACVFEIFVYVVIRSFILLLTVLLYRRRDNQRMEY